MTDENERVINARSAAAYNMRQAIANARIDGFEPDEFFYGLADQVVHGALTADQAIERLIEHAKNQAV